MLGKGSESQGSSKDKLPEGLVETRGDCQPTESAKEEGPKHPTSVPGMQYVTESSSKDAPEWMRGRSLESKLQICEEAREHSAELLHSLIQDLSYTLASLQDFLENALMAATGTPLTVGVPKLPSVFALCSDLIKAMAARVDGFESSIKRGASRYNLPYKDIFSPGLLNQLIADVMAILAAPKGIEIVVMNPHESSILSRYNLHLLLYDQDFLRQILYHWIFYVIRKAQSNSTLEQNYLFKNIELDESLGVSRVDVVFQVKYQKAPEHGHGSYFLDDFYIDKLQRFAGSYVRRAEGKLYVEEIHIKCRGLPFSEISRYLGYHETTGHFPYSIDELLLFSGKLKGYQVLISTSKWSPFLENLTAFFKSWETDLICSVAGKNGDLQKELSRAEASWLKGNKEAHRLLITDEVESLQRCVRYLNESSSAVRFDQAFMFSNIDNFEATEVRVALMRQERKEDLFPILVVTKPCGPERLLFLMRLVESSQTRLMEEPVVRLATELPPLGKPYVLSAPEMPDISRFVSVLLVEGRFLSRTAMGQC